MDTAVLPVYRSLFVCLLVLALPACDNLGVGGEPDQISVEIEATGAEQLALVTSTDWLLIPDPGCNPDEQQCAEVLRLLQADTAAVAAPYSRTFQFTNTRRYFLEVHPAGGVAATLTMRIKIDGKDWYDESRQIPAKGDGEQQTLQFVYRWQEPTLR
ncbi:MAG: hypothetical protein RH859_06995 [Longimicrobiales bacterium]